MTLPNHHNQPQARQGMNRRNTWVRQACPICLETQKWPITQTDVLTTNHGNTFWAHCRTCGRTVRIPIRAQQAAMLIGKGARQLDWRTLTPCPAPRGMFHETELFLLRAHKMSGRKVRAVMVAAAETILENDGS